MDGGYVRTINRCVKQAEAERVPVFNTLWQPIYEAYSVKEFNAFMEAYVSSLYKRYKFPITCCSEWVSPHAWYRFSKGAELPGDLLRPLNYWAVTEKVLILPTESELELELIWRKLLAHRFPSARRRKDPLEEIHYEDVHSAYVRDICNQVIRLESLLQKWVQLNRPLFQAQCMFNHDRDREVLRCALRGQNINMLEAKRRFEIFRSTDAPRFVLDIVKDQVRYETSILEGLHKAVMSRS